MTYYLYFFTARFAWDAKAAELDIISFAVEGTAKENSSSFIKVILYSITGSYFFVSQGGIFLLFGVPVLWNACPMKCNAYFIGATPIPLGSAKSNKKPKTLRFLRLSGE